jgi:mRNA interferase MazF
MMPRLGDVWVADLGITGKVRPVVIVLDENISVERSLVIYVPVTSQNRGTPLEMPLGHIRFLSPDSVANVQAIGSVVVDN